MKVRATLKLHSAFENSVQGKMRSELLKAFQTGSCQYVFSVTWFEVQEMIGTNILENLL